MKLIFDKAERANPDFLMRRCGYGKIAKRSGEVSYARLLGRSGYPRFHAYVDMGDKGLQVNVHLDQKQPTYGAHTAHSGEYDGPVVEREAERIHGLIERML